VESDQAELSDQPLAMLPEIWPLLPETKT
jgi:hypothetical protein